MINNIRICGYKCFDDDDIELKNLTLLTGTNSSGKSSCIQSILLLGKHENGTDIIDFMDSLGSFEDLRNKYTNPKKITLNTEINGNLVEFSIDKNDHINIASDDILTYPKNLTYLNANRVPIPEINNISKLKDRYFGINGNFIISYYEQHKNDIIPFILDPRTKATLSGQIDYWIKNIFQIDLDFLTNKISSTHTRALYKIDQVEYKPENLGTGISYLISILVACLSAQKGNIIIIDNPEIHLHPKAQSKLLNFFSFIANQGVQLILESHSDHIFNGIRKNIYLKNNSEDDSQVYLDNTSVAIHYFDNNKRTKIVLDDDGQVQNHQDGLFDQFEDDINALLGLQWM